MVDFKSIDERTNLAGTNRLELLMFRLQDKRDPSNTALYGINVFKVREIIEVPELIKVPQYSEFVAGIATIRGRAIPAIDLGRYCECECDDEDNKSGVLIITEFNRSTQGFFIHKVENIIQLEWSKIQEPPDVVRKHHKNTLTAISQIDDDQMLLILDVERVIADVLGSGNEAIESAPIPSRNKGRHVFFADDSLVARKQVGRILERMGIIHDSAKSGLDAFTKLTAMAEEAERKGQHLSEILSAIITDVEMPEMDGYVLTAKIKEDPRFNGIPVMMHTSLSASENLRLGMKVGADAYIPKLQPTEFSHTLDGLLNNEIDGFAKCA
ncbi:MAG: chemotaxis protein [Granulosicoccus sp.]